MTDTLREKVEAILKKHLHIPFSVDVRQLDGDPRGLFERATEDILALVEEERLVLPETTEFTKGYAEGAVSMERYRVVNLLKGMISNHRSTDIESLKELLEAIEGRDCNHHFNGAQKCEDCS